MTAARFAPGSRLRWSYGDNRGRIGVVQTVTHTPAGTTLTVLLPSGKYVYVNLKPEAVKA